jgi:hypothetical protein
MTTPSAVCELVIVSSSESEPLGLRQLRQPKIEDLDAPVFGDENIFRLQVAVDDPFVMRRRQSVGDLHSIFDRLALRQGAAIQRRAQALALQQVRRR